MVVLERPHDEAAVVNGTELVDIVPKLSEDAVHLRAVDGRLSGKQAQLGQACADRGLWVDCVQALVEEVARLVPGEIAEGRGQVGVTANLVEEVVDPRLRKVGGEDAHPVGRGGAGGLEVDPH